MERQEICSSEMGHQTILRWRSNDSFSMREETQMKKLVSGRLRSVQLSITLVTGKKR